MQLFFGDVACAAFGMLLMACGELVLAYAPFLSVSLLGMWSVYMGQAIAGATIASITSMLATEERRGQVMSMQQMSQALGRVVGPLCLGRLSDIDPCFPFALAAAATTFAAALLGTLHGAYKRRSVVADSSPTPAMASSLSWAIEEYAEEDVQDLGRFLCELLSAGHYQWRDPVQREALKSALRICFPPLNGDDIGRAGDFRMVLANRKGADANFDGSVLGTPMDFAGDGVGFLSSPMIVHGAEDVSVSSLTSPLLWRTPRPENALT